MSLIDALATPPEEARTWRSKMDVWLTTLSDDERAAVLAAALNPAWSHSALLQTLRQNGGPDITDNTLRVWRIRQGWKRDA